VRHGSPMAGSGSESTELSARTVLEQIAIRRIPSNFAGSLSRGPFTLRE
jgi:hypothetical protein